MYKNVVLNKGLLLVVTFIVILIGYSFYEYFDFHFSYVKEYYEIIEKCGESGKSPDDKICKYINTDELVNKMKKNQNPIAKYKKLDAITLTCSIVEQTKFSTLQLLSPLIIIVCVALLVHRDFSTGMIQNYLTRMTYKKYIRRQLKKIAIVSLLFPLSLLLIFLISCLLTKFNFSIDSMTTELAVYGTWKYNHFLIYGSIICLLQYLLSFAYGCIGFVCCKKNKNLLVSIIMGYVSSLAIVIFIYVFLYAIIINKILGIRELTDYFALSGYWFFDDSISLIGVVFVALLFSIIIYIITKISYKDKERTLLENEKQVA